MPPFYWHLADHMKPLLMNNSTITRLSIAFLLFIPISYADTARQQVINVDGREVLLNEDGSWNYASTDRYANTADGRRVRLKEDGSWQYTGNTPMATKEQVRTAELDIKLQKVVIETFKKKVQKNSHIRTQTVFYLNLEHSPQAKNTIHFNKRDIALIKVKDNNGRNYPVLSIKPGVSELAPDSKTTLVIRAKKSPSIWDAVKSMNITFNVGIFGIEEAITLSQRVIDFNEENVDGFEKTD